jgi:hypothetical protein
MGGDIIQLIPFVRAFYAFESPMFYNHYNCEGEVTVIPFAMGTYQGDPLGGALFVLAHFKALRSTTSYFPFCLFSSITYDIHIIGPPFNYITWIWTFPNWIPSDKYFYPTSEVCNMVPF